MPTMTVVTNAEMTKKGAQVRCLIFSAPGVHPSLEPYPPEYSSSLAETHLAGRGGGSSRMRRCHRSKLCGELGNDTPPHALQCRGLIFEGGRYGMVQQQERIFVDLACPVQWRLQGTGTDLRSSPCRQGTTTRRARRVTRARADHRI